MNLQNLPQFNLERCTQCGVCVSDCPEEALEMQSNGPAFKSPVNCTYCTLCEQVCPTGAIRAPYVFRWTAES